MLPRVLVVHNRYRSELPSGENQAVDRQISLLRGAGVDVETYIRSSDEIATFSSAKRLELAVRPIYSREDVTRFDIAVNRFQPDVVHIHNVYPLISPVVVTRAKSHGCRVVQTVHNFRHICASGTFFRAGSACTDCLGKRVPWPAALHGCYRDSRAQSVAMGAAIMRHRKTWLQIDRFLPVSEFVADVLANAGIPREQICVVPNSIDDPGPPSALGHGFLFAGRLSNEKGVGLLLAAWEHSALGNTTQLTIVGDGPERAAVERAAKGIPGVRYAGPVSADEVRTHIREARVVVVPSIWFEALPTVLLEAYACGRPVVATQVGALATLVSPDVGWLAPPNQDGLAATLKASSGDPDATAMAKRARELYLAQYAPVAGLTRLMETYRNLLPAAKRGVPAGATEGDS